MVKNKADIQEGLAELTRSERLYGQNAYNCEKCCKKVNAQKTTTVD